MALATRRAYAGAAPACTLSSDINASATSFSITGTVTNWPTTATGPFYMVIDPGLSTEEKVLVVTRSTGSLSSVTRGVDGTTASSHVTGATCYPVFTAVDANDANLLASRLTAKGDLLSTDGTDPTKVAVGSNNTRLVADSAQTSGIKWVADTQNTVVDAKGDLLVGSAADTVARLAVGGTNGQALVVDSNATNGVAWAETGGLVFIKQQTIGTSVSSVAVSSAFSSTYANYRIVIAHPQSSNNDGLRIQFGSTTTGYYGSLFYYIYTGGTSGYSSFNNGANMDVALSDTTANTFTTFDVGNPNAASRTYINGTYWGRGFTGYFSGTEVSTTQHTAFTILPSTGGGTLTGGKIYVYGYRNE